MESPYGKPDTELQEQIRRAINRANRMTGDAAGFVWWRSFLFERGGKVYRADTIDGPRAELIGEEAESARDEFRRWAKIPAATIGDDQRQFAAGLVDAWGKA